MSGTLVFEMSRRAAGAVRAAARALATPRLGNGGPAEGGCRVRIEQRLALGPQHALVMLRIRDKHLLVATSPAGCQLIDRFEPEPPVRSGETDS